MKMLKSALVAGALALTLLTPTIAMAEYGGQGPIEPYDPIIKAEKEGKTSNNRQRSDAAEEAYTGHLTSNPHIVNKGDGTRGDHQTAPIKAPPEPPKR